MLRTLSFSLIALAAIACGKDSKKSDNAAPRDLNLVPTTLAGTYQQTEGGIALLEIDSRNIITGTTLAIPSPAGDGTRLTPQFPQQLVLDEATQLFKTIGTFNDGTSVFKNIEMRIRPYEMNELLDVTLVYPPDAALPSQCVSGNRKNITLDQTVLLTTTGGKGPGKPSPGPTPGPTPGQTCGENPSQQGSGSTVSTTNPGQNPGGDTCVCPTQIFYVYRFERI